MRRFSLFVLLCGCLLGPGLLMTPLKAEDEAKQEQPAIPALTEEEVSAIGRISAILGTETKLDVIEMPLDDVYLDIAKEHKINITVDPAVLKRAEVMPAKLITLNVKGVQLRTLLRIMLKPHKLTYKIRPDGLLITSLPAKAPEPKK